MNPHTGEIVTLESQEALMNQALVPLTELEHQQLKPKTRDQRKNWMRNRPCPCGSERKFKRCCWSKYG